MNAARAPTLGPGDATSSKTARLSGQALADSEELLRLLLDGVSGYAIYMLDPLGHVASWNLGAERLKGYLAEEVLGHDVSIFFTDEDVAAGKPRKELERAVTDGRFEQEAIRVRKDGSRFWAHVVISPLRGDDGQLRGFAKITSDITRRKTAEAALERSNSILATTFASIQEGVVVADPAGNVVLSNPMARQLLGAKTLETKVGEWSATPGIFLADGKTPVPSGDLPLARALQGEKVGAVKLFVQQPGEASGLFLTVTAGPLRDPDGASLGAVSTFRDVTTQTRADAILRAYTTRLEHSNRELETFASVASHDLQEPLRKIRAFGDLLMSRYADQLEVEGQDYLKRMRSAAGRMQDLIENLLTFSRVATKPQALARIDLAQIAREVATDLEARLLETQGRLELGALPTLEGDATQLRQLLQNLIANALKFHRPGVPPRVTVSARELPAATPAEASAWELRVEDNGLGFEAKHAERIFGIFQRLHGRGEFEGTGIGLAICRRIVERHHGTIVGLGTPDHGATFVVTLPSTQPQDPGGVR